MTRTEQIFTLKDWISKRGMSQKQFQVWLDGQGLIISPQYLNDVLNNRRAPGPKFISIFKEITGTILVSGLVEVDRGKETS